MLTRIVKVGGSLLDWPGLRGALHDWLNGQPSAVNVLLAGGGALADAVRQADRNFSLDAETAHWLCIDVMSMNTRLLAAILPAARLIATVDALRAELSYGLAYTVVFDAREFLYEHEARLLGRTLPHDWSVTSDSIAARLAEVLAADELVLLKSSDPPSTSLAELMEAGYVDSHFPTIECGRSPPRFVNLRAGRESSALASHLVGEVR